jgi:hypothetical protein
MVMARSKRALSVEAIDALIRGATVSVAKRHDWELLEEIARIAQMDAPTDMAVTDPAMFVMLRNAITRFHLKGWSRMTPERVRSVAARAQQASRAV